MRNTPAGHGSTWAALVKEGRQAKRYSQDQLAAMLGTNRTTVWRWEAGRVRPDSIELAEKTIAALNLDRAAALIAAGYAVATTEQAEADPMLSGLDPKDPVVLRIMRMTVDDAFKARMLNRHRDNLERARQQSLADLDWVEREREAG